MAKGPGGNINTANSITGSQLGVASEAGQRSANDYQQFRSLLQPLITRDTALAGGDRQAALAAAMPVISQLSAGWNGAKQNILNGMPAGASRDRALADLTMQMFTSIGGAQAGLVQQAPQNLAAVGGQFGNMSLQDLGAQLSALQGGSTTNFNAGQMEAQRQKALLDFFGGLAGSAAGMFAPIKICWIAEAIYGEDNLRTAVLRAWLNGPFQETRAGACVMQMYRVIGHRVAWAARHSRLVRAALRPLFDCGLRRSVVYAYGLTK